MPKKDKVKSPPLSPLSPRANQQAAAGAASQSTQMQLVPNKHFDVATDDVALFMAMEEEQSGLRSWDQDQELDYEQISKKSGGQTQNEQHNVSDVFNYIQLLRNQVLYLGCLPGIKLRSPELEAQTDILEAIDTAQAQGRLPWCCDKADTRKMLISKYGIKLMDSQKQKVFGRHALHRIVGIVYYRDTYNNEMVAIKVGRVEPEKYDIYIYQCEDEEQARDICMALAQAFEAVYNKNQDPSQNKET